MAFTVFLKRTLMLKFANEILQHWPSTQEVDEEFGPMCKVKVIEPFLLLKEMA